MPSCRLTTLATVGISFTSAQEAVREGHQVQAALFVVDAADIYCPRLAGHLT